MISRRVPVSAASEEAHDLPRSLILFLGQERASDTQNESLSEESQNHSYNDLQCDILCASHLSLVLRAPGPRGPCLMRSYSL